MELKELNIYTNYLKAKIIVCRYISFILISIMLLLIYSYHQEVNKLKEERDYYMSKIKSFKDSVYNYTKLNEKNILFWCDYFNVKFSRVVLAQMKLESGNFTSDLSIIHNNLSGMKKTRVRNTTAIYETKTGFSGYTNYIEHIKDIKMWQDFNYIDTIRTEKDYIDYLSKVYADDKNYKSKIYKMLNTKK